MSEQLDAMIEQIGSLDKVIKFYKKKTEEDFRSYFFDIIKLNKLTSQMQKKIVLSRQPSGATDYSASGIPAGLVLGRVCLH